MNPALELRAISVDLSGHRVLERATARFTLGHRHAVIGRSGAGKSVLMKACCGLLPLSEGQVILGDITANRSSPGLFAGLRQKVAFVHQDPALLDDLDVLDNVRFVAERRDPAGAAEAVARWMDALSLRDVQHLRPPQLSPGKLRRVAIARALATTPEILIVDEPTTGLDPRAAREVDAALADLGSSGATLIVITHDLRSLARLVPEICWVHEGSVRWQGPLGDARAVDPALDALLSGRPLEAEAA